MTRQIHQFGASRVIRTKGLLTTPNGGSGASSVTGLVTKSDGRRSWPCGPWGLSAEKFKVPGMDVVIADESTSGDETARMLLQSVPSPVSLRELIRLRVREEVARFNADTVPVFAGLVRPAGAEVTVNGYRLRVPRVLDWEKQAAIAIEAFGRNGFFVFAGGRQVDDLDEELTLAEAQVVSFMRLVPLVGG